MASVEKILSFKIGETSFTGLLKVKSEKWCFIHEGNAYFKIYFRKDRGNISFIGERLEGGILKAMTAYLQVQVEEAMAKYS